MPHTHLQLVSSHEINPDSSSSILLSRLADEITQLSAHLDAGTFQLLKLICEFDEREGWGGVGIKSCAHWLNWKCGMNLGAAREKVRVARSLPELPKIRAALREGKVSYPKVRAMTRIATSKNEQALLEVALGGTASHVEQQVRLYRNTKRFEALEDENLRHSQRELSWYQDDDGSWVFKGRFTPEQGALISKALEAAMDQLFKEQKDVPEDVSAETSNDHSRVSSEPVAARRADALERVAEGFLAGAQDDHFGGETSMDNLVLLCRNHHRLVHEGGFGVHTSPNDIINFTLPNGKLIPRGPETRFRGNVLVLKARNRDKGLNITPKTPIPAWYGDRMDHNMAVEALLQME